MQVVRVFKISAAHYLPGYVGKCKQLHGHTYILHVIFDGEVNPDTGMVIDFHEIDRIVNQRIWSKLDHSLLNDTIENPTAENVASYIHKTLSESLPDFKTGIKLWEDPDAYVEIPL